MEQLQVGAQRLGKLCGFAYGREGFRGRILDRDEDSTDGAHGEVSLIRFVEVEYLARSHAGLRMLWRRFVSSRKEEYVPTCMKCTIELTPVRWASSRATLRKPRAVLMPRAREVGYLITAGPDKTRIKKSAPYESFRAGLGVVSALRYVTWKVAARSRKGDCLHRYP